MAKEKKPEDEPKSEGKKADKKGEAKKGDGKKADAKKPDAEAKKAGPPPTPRLQERYFKEILPALEQKLGRKNRLSLPRLEKIVVNMGVGTAITEKKHMEDAVAALSQITGQKPLVCKARKSVANFRLREGMEIGCKVTLRGRRMYEFLDRLISLALPRVRDFRGLDPHGFDRRGNYNLGLSEQLVFPELNPDKFTRPQGMSITLVCSTDSDDESRELLRSFGMPFKAIEAPAKKKSS
jgi:large subunit ribosomal protein L5